VIASQIKSILAPADFWAAQPLNGFVQDAMDIERRIHKKVNVRGESSRYLIICNRIQQIGAAYPDVEAHDWKPSDESHGPYALCLLAASTILRAWVQSNSQLGNIRDRLRIGKLFSPPTELDADIQLLELLFEKQLVTKLFASAIAKSPFNNIDPVVGPSGCVEALQIRLQLLKTARDANAGVVDVII
jgi:hypothetical protein